MTFASGSALFQYVQLFLVWFYFKESVKYKQTFFWADDNNKKITNLISF